MELTTGKVVVTVDPVVVESQWLVITSDPPGWCNQMAVKDENAFSKI